MNPVRKFEELPVSCLGNVMGFLATSEDMKFFIFCCKKLYSVFKSEQERNQVKSYNFKNIQDKHLLICHQFKRLEKVDLSKCRYMTDQGLGCLIQLPLKILNLSSTNITPQALSHIQNLPLVDLDLSLCEKMDDIALSFLKNISTLSRLNLEDCPRITDGGILSISILSIKEIKIRGCRHITNMTLLSLSHMTLKGEAISPRSQATNSLTSLTIELCPHITDEGMAYLQDLPLTTLCFLGCKQITDATFFYLEKMPLKQLGFSGCNITDEGLTHLSSGKCFILLNHLDLSNCKGITDQSLSTLQTLAASLVQLDLWGCQITEEGFRTTLRGEDLKRFQKFDFRKTKV